MAGRQVTFGFLMVLFSLCASCEAETTTKGNQEDKSVTIPLDQIWAWRMPGTQNIMAKISDDTEQKQADWSRVEDICRSLHPLRADQQSERAFAVQGSGMEALTNAHAVRAQGNKADKSFARGTEVSLFFFSHAMNPYVHLSGVQLRGRVIEIEYRLVPTIDAGRTVHFALIPLKNLSPGEYQVKMIRFPTDKEFADWGVKPLSKEFTDRVICKPFRLTVDGSQSK